MTRRVVTHDLYGWDQIADAIGVCERTARKYAKLEPDPLPVDRFFGRVRAHSDDVEEWFDRRILRKEPPRVS